MKQIFQLVALSTVNISIGFLFQWYVLTQLGPGIETDGLFAGMTIPQLVLAVISGSLMHVLVPILAGEDEERLRHDAWGLLVLVGGLFGLFAAILYLAAPWWVPLIFPGFDEAGKALTVALTRIQLIGMVFAAINGVQSAAYHARQHFVWPEFSPILASTFALLLLIWALPTHGVIAAAWISSLRMAIQTLLLVPGIGRPVPLDLNSAAIQQAWLRIKPLIAGTAYYKTDPLVDRFLLSMASSGNLSLYYLAQQIYGAASQVLNKAISVPLVPLLSRLHKAGDREGFNSLYHRQLIVLSLISIVILLLLGLIGQGILTILVGHGNVNDNNIIELWWIMIWLSGMFMGGTVGQISSSAFYACGDTKTPTQMSVFTFTAYIPAKVIAFYYWGVIGLALATSIYYMTNLFLQVYLLEKKRFL